MCSGQMEGGDLNYPLLRPPPSPVASSVIKVAMKSVEKCQEKESQREMKL